MSMAPVHGQETESGVNASRCVLLCEAQHGMAGNSA